MLNSYEVLGVSPDSSDQEIKLAYHSLAKKYHPDLHPSDRQAASKMNQINMAYQDIQSQRSRGYTQTQEQNRTYYRPYENPSYQSEHIRPKRSGLFYIFAGIAVVNIITLFFGRGLPFFFFFI